MDLNLLKDQDPEFFKYLQENDAELLDFNADMALDAEEDSDEEHTSTGPIILSQSQVNAWSKTLVQVPSHSVQLFVFHAHPLYTDPFPQNSQESLNGFQNCSRGFRS